MAVTAERLRALRRQAGGVTARDTPRASSSDATPPAAAQTPAPFNADGPRAADIRRPVAADVTAAAAPPGNARVDGPPLAGALRTPFARPAVQSIEALRRLLGVRGLAPPVARGPVDRSLPGEPLAPGLLLTTARVPMPIPEEPLPLAFARRDDHVPASRLLFFDTETTGLAGGTGTRAFMIGAADWHRDPVHGDGLRIRQLLITSMAAERAMLEVFASWLVPGTVLSSYNGRCYDAPLLKTRYRLARMADPLSGLDHVDLLFPTRRRYRGVWENCRLATIERELLAIVREDDLPGSQAPAAWLGYLRGGAATLLRRVAAHNHQDVVTLARLIQRLVEVEAATSG
ncbi:MAG TPA: ribonuclease H-like domain-containing protein [Luteimonas sp.]|nr:ribonuclease H-like domain-containing protein [Luteimonas sp.]